MLQSVPSVIYRLVLLFVYFNALLVHFKSSLVSIRQCVIDVLLKIECTLIRSSYNIYLIKLIK